VTSKVIDQSQLARIEFFATDSESSVSIGEFLLNPVQPTVIDLQAVPEPASAPAFRNGTRGPCTAQVCGAVTNLAAEYRSA
jgi:hypothetical protein